MRKNNKLSIRDTNNDLLENRSSSDTNNHSFININANTPLELFPAPKTYAAEPIPALLSHSYNKRTYSISDR